MRYENTATKDGLAQQDWPAFRGAAFSFGYAIQRVFLGISLANAAVEGV